MTWPSKDLLALQDRMMALVREFGLHQPDRTPCGEPVPISEAHALAELAGDGSLSQRELGMRLRLEKSTVSRLLQQLEERGWVVRREDERDGRVVRPALTVQGRRKATQLAQARSARFARLLEGIPARERAAVLASLSVLVEAARDRR